MRNIKLQLDLAGDKHWPFISKVTVDGDNFAKAIPSDASQPEGEKVVQSWKKAAVLRVEPDIDVYFGFMAGDHIQFLNKPIERKDGCFGVHVGDGKVDFFIIPVDLTSRPKLKLVEVTTINDPKYSDLPLY